MFLLMEFHESSSKRGIHSGFASGIIVKQAKKRVTLASGTWDRVMILIPEF